MGPDQRAPPPRLSPFEYRYLTEFQSHEPEFDYLKSLEIEEKINQVLVLNRCDIMAVLHVECCSGSWSKPARWNR